MYICHFDFSKRAGLVRVCETSSRVLTERWKRLYDFVEYAKVPDLRESVYLYDECKQ